MTKRKKLLFKFMIAIITYLIIELGCFICIRSGFIPAKEPDFKFVWNNPKYPLPMADVDTVWGTWHYKEHFQSQNGCVTFDYNINSYGARDKERTLKSNDTSRVVVLGDSFFEGNGIPENKRISNLLEAETKHEFLNFACSDLGPTQQYLIYKHLASKFDHSTILIGFLPFNDFENDDTSFYATKKRYRPFFVKTDTGYQLKFLLDSIQQSELNKEHYNHNRNSFKQTVTRFLRAYTYWYNIADLVINRKAQSKAYRVVGNSTVSYYYDYTAEQMERLDYVLANLRKLAPDKRIILASIPLLPDYDRYKKTKKPPPLPGELKKICDANRIQFIDLMDAMIKEEKVKQFFLPCDPHWSEKGHSFNAELILPFFKKTN